MRRSTILFLLILLLLSGCNLPTSPVVAPAPTIDAVATEVSQLLTAMPTATQTQAAVVTATEVPSNTPLPETPTPGPSATGQASPAPTTPAGDPRNTFGEPTWRDSLDTSESFSYLYENEGTRISHETGALVLTGRLANGWTGWTMTFKQQPQNFYLETVFQVQTCAGADTYGVVFRAPDTNAGYFFGVTCDGRYSLHASNFNDGEDKRLIQLTANNAIVSGSNTTNRLGILVDGDKIGLYANGTLLQEVTDTTFQEKGYFGPYIAANATVDFTVRLDEMTLWKQQ